MLRSILHGGNQLRYFAQAVVVGGTSGIGSGVALALAKKGVSVVICGRNKIRGNEIVERMKKVSSSDKAEFKFVECDASLMNNVRECVDSMKLESLDYLVLTQGRLNFANIHKTTIESIDRNLALYYYGRVAFMKLFTPLLLKSKQPRIMTVLSPGIPFPFSEDIKCPEIVQNKFIVSNMMAWGFYNDLAVDSISKDFPISCSHVFPGVVFSNWGSELPWPLSIIVRTFLKLFGNSPEVIGEKLNNLLMDEKYASPGYYLLTSNGKIISKNSMHDKARESIWNNTNHILNKFGVK